KVAPRAHSIPDLVEIVLQVGFELLQRLSVPTGRTSIRFDRLERFKHLLLIDIERFAGHSHRDPPVTSCLDAATNPIRSLRSDPITEPSSLLRIGPSQCSASV